MANHLYHLRMGRFGDQVLDVQRLIVLPLAPATIV